LRGAAATLRVIHIQANLVAAMAKEIVEEDTARASASTSLPFR
jgi:hypothetical protein